MKRSISLLIALVLSASPGIGHVAEATGQDPRAVDILQQMSDYKDTLTAFRISGTSNRDVRLAAGLVVSSSEEVTVSLERPGSLRFSGFDGRNRRELLISDGHLSVSDSATATYATAEVPDELDLALDTALEDYDIDLPLMDLLHTGVASRLVKDTDRVIYVGDKRRVAGVDCHHIAIRTDEADVQLWVQEGVAPLPRQILITDKWGGGSPRFVGQMHWDTSPDLPEGIFDFKPPEDAARVEFVNALAGE